MHSNDVQPVIKILPKPSFINHPLQVDVCCGDDTDVNFDGLNTPQTHKLPLLYHAKQFGLGFERHIPYFIEKDTPSVG